MAEKLLTETAEKALRLVEESQGHHDSLVGIAQQRWREFEGHLDQSKDSAQWMSQLHPPYLNHIVETTVAGLLEDRLMFKVTPTPRFFNPGELEKAQNGAKAHEILLRAQLKNDHFNEFQRPFVLDATVVGLGWGKTFWRNESQKKKYLELKQHNGVDYLDESEKVDLVFDGPVTEAVDIRDMYWHEAAVSVEKARWIAHAVWMSKSDLQALAKRGVYDEKAINNLDEPVDGGDTSLEKERESRGRNKDLYEVLEIWNRETGRVITIANRKVVLSEKDWPFWHKEYPFVVTSLQPFPRSLKGMSIVEKLAHLQEMTWDLMNQRIDNTRFINNFIQIIRSDVDDPDGYPFEPGAQWFMEDPKSVEQWAPNPLPAEVTLGAESILKQDMQNLAGGQPFTSTSEASQQTGGTATEAALVTNLAQLTVKQMKTQIFYAYGRIGCQRLYLNQQFIREPMYVETIGLDAEQEVKEILPYLLQGEYRFDIDPMAESLNRSEKRAEANALFQIVAQTAPVAAASGSPWNFKAFQEDLLKSNDKDNTDRYLSAQPQAGMQQAAGGQPQQGQVQPGPNGVTAQQSIDPAVSPSAQASLSPATFQARNLALNGGANNV